MSKEEGVLPDNKEELTTEYLKSIFPKNFWRSIDSDFVEEINDILSDKDYRDSFRETMMNCTDIITERKYSLKQYVRAVKFVTYKLLGDTTKQSWCKAYPERYADAVAKGSNFAKRAEAYGRSQLVKKIEQRLMIPTWVLNADTYQQAINKQLSLMTNEKVSAHVQQLAANSLLTHLKQPEEINVNVKMEAREESIIDSLRETAFQLAKVQKDQLESGATSLKTIGASTITLEHKNEED